VLSAWASRETRELGAQCSVEAKVSIERNGPHGTFAGDRTDPSESKLAATISFQGTRWTAGSSYFRGRGGSGFATLDRRPKNVILGRRSR
jgi:hypothetical protein